MKKPSLYVTYCVRPGWGYAAEVYYEGKLVEEYSAGDCAYDSQVYATGQVKEDQLRSFAKQTALETIAQLLYERKGGEYRMALLAALQYPITEDDDMLPEDINPYGTKIGADHDE